MESFTLSLRVALVEVYWCCSEPFSSLCNGVDTDILCPSLARVLCPHRGWRPLASIIKPRHMCRIVLVYFSISVIYATREDVEGGVGFLGDIRQRPIRPPTNEPSAGLNILPQMMQT